MAEQWETKAQTIIRELSEQAYRSVNYYKNGTRRRKHVPYSLPVLATQLIAVLGWHDRVEAERQAKAMFIMYAQGVNCESNLFFAA